MNPVTPGSDVNGPMPHGSDAFDPVGGLLRTNLLDPPRRPGDLASLGPYDVLRWLGAGGMGVVLLARDSRSGSLVAIKCLRPELAGHPQAIHRFRTELKHAQGLAHPHLLPVLEVVDRPAGPCCVMPYLERGSLALAIPPGAPLPVEQALRIARQMAGALVFLHARGLVHRDVKPGNILLENDGTARLADLGLARTVFNDSLVDVRACPREGTPAYMSPAVAAGVAEDTRCDIYAWGAVLYEMLTGHAPYSGDRPEEVLSSIRAGPPRPMREWQPTIPGALVRVVEGAMARELRDRYAEMGDALADLERAAHRQAPVGPRMAGTVRLEPHQGLLRRRAVPVIAGIVTAAILTAGVLAALAFMRPRLAVAWTMEPLRPGGDGALLLGQHDRSGNRALFQVLNGVLYARSCRGQILQQWDLSFISTNARLAKLVNANVVDVDRKPSDAFFLHWSDDDRAHCVVMDQAGSILGRFEATGNVTRKDGELLGQPVLFPEIIEDINGDGAREFLATMITGYGDQPCRGVYCFDVGSGTQRWHRLMAPFPNVLISAAATASEPAGILCGSYSPGNHVSLPDGTDDEHSYLYRFSAISGDFLWRKMLGGYYEAVEPFKDVPGLPESEVLVTVRGKSIHAAPGYASLIRISQDGRELARQYHPISLCSYLPTQLNGCPVLLAGDYLGNLLVFDPRSLELKQKVQVAATNHANRVELLIHGKQDLDGDGKDEIVLTSQQHVFLSGDNLGNARRPPNDEYLCDFRIWIFGSDLKPRANLLVASRQKGFSVPTVHIADFDEDGYPEILLIDKSNLMLRYRSGWPQQHGK